MKWIIIVAIAAILLCAGAASGHRMFVGQRMSLDLYVLYDDGSPAAMLRSSSIRMASSSLRMSPMPGAGSA